MVGLWRANRVVDLGDLRVAGGLMLAAAAVRPFVGNPGVPCPLRCLTGIPCPLCGMTTSVTDAVHLHVGSALAANPMGLVAAVAAVVLVVLGRRIERLVVPALVVPVAMSVGLAGMWLFELHRFKFL